MVEEVYLVAERMEEGPLSPVLAGGWLCINHLTYFALRRRSHMQAIQHDDNT